MIPYGKPSVLLADIAKVDAVFKTPTLTRGDTVFAFEEAFARSCGAAFAVSFNSGSSALAASCFAADINASDRLISTPNTFIATAGAAVSRGARPTFIDIDRQTGNLQEDLAIQAINTPMSRGKSCFIPVHFSGIAVDMQHIDLSIANPNAIVIEDASHALGSTYPSGEKVGSCSFSAMTVFSFHPVKTITTGEGGMVTTNNLYLRDKLLLFRNNGIVYDPKVKEEAPWHYDVVALTGNFHLTEFQAALGLSQLERLDTITEKRRFLVACYRKFLKDVPHLRLFNEDSDPRSCYHLFVVQIDFKAVGKSRAFLMDILKGHGILTQVHYIPLYRHTVFKQSFASFPETESYYDEALSLPLHVDLEEEDIYHISQTLINCVN